MALWNLPQRGEERLILDMSISQKVWVTLESPTLKLKVPLRTFQPDRLTLGHLNSNCTGNAQKKWIKCLKGMWRGMEGQWCTICCWNLCALGLLLQGLEASSQLGFKEPGVWNQFSGVPVFATKQSRDLLRLVETPSCFLFKYSSVLSSSD
jgi:hypothetical protein